MGIKRVVDVDFWTDEKVMDMFTPEDKLFFIYLLTNPHTTQLGIYAINPKYIQVELGYSSDSVDVLLDRFENQYNIIKYSKKTKEIAVKNFLKHSIIKGGAPVRDCLIRELKAVKNKELINFVFAHIKQYENLNKTVRDIIDEYEEMNGEVVYCYDKRKSVQKENNENDNVNDNENENENENEVSCNDSLDESPTPPPPPKKKSNTTVDYELFKDIYNRFCSSLPQIRVLSDKRKKAIREFLKELDFCYFEEACKKANESNFLTGQNDRGWKADFDFIIKPEKALSIIEGGKYGSNSVVKKYDDAKTEEIFKAQQKKYFSCLDENKPAPKTAGENEEVRERAEELKRRLSGA